MEWTLARFCRAVIFGSALCTACTFGQVGIDFNGSASSPALFHPGAFVDFHVWGPGGAPFAALISSEPLFEVTPYGLLLANPFAHDAAVIFDGFDPSHPTFGTAIIPYGGPFAQTFIPFLPGEVYEPAYWVQALVADPTHPLGLRLTNEIVLVKATPPPSLTAIAPNFIFPGGAVTVLGSDFENDPALNVVRLNGMQLPVLSATATSLFVHVPPGARSGTVSVETTHGATPASSDALASWLAVTPALFCEPAQVPLVVEGPITVVGTLPYAATKDYVVHLEAGEEIVAEAYVFDLVNYVITNQANASTPYFDPIIRVRRNPALPITVLMDDDSGPNVTAAVGLPAGSPHYVAPFAEDVVVQIDSQGSLSGGPYLLALWTRPAVGLPVTVQCVLPSDARIGDYVTILGSGFDPSEVDCHTVVLNGASTAPETVTPGSITFVVPPGARSGPVVITTSEGQSPPDLDRIQSWLCVRAPDETYAVEGTVAAIPAAGVVKGTLAPATDQDDFTVALVAGQTLSLECHAVDPAAGTFVSGSILALSPVDLEIRIMAAGATALTLAYDQNSGPGLSAGFGLHPANPPFTAPHTGTFVVRVNSFFGWSQGDYFLAIGPGP
jgi:IPT/TIG domain